MTIYARFIQRNAGSALAERGTFVCESAEGKEILDGIGYGKVVIPHYDNARLAANERIQPGDVCITWTDAPDGEGHYISCFLVQTRNYKGGRLEVSGPDFIAELQEYVAIAPIGEQQEVVTIAKSMGNYTIQQPEPDPDTTFVMEAAYPSRGGVTVNFKEAGRTSLGLVDPVPFQVTDVVEIRYPNGEIFETPITGKNHLNKEILFNDPLPQDTPIGTKVHIRSLRIRVDNAEDLEEGARLFYTPAAYGSSNPRPRGNIMVDSIEMGDDEPSYVYSADPITDHILRDTPVSQILYTEPTTNDIEQLLGLNTFYEWDVERGEDTTLGTAYAPNAETVWDVLLAIRDTAGYHFRRKFYGQPAHITLTVPYRVLEYFRADEPVTPAQVAEYGMERVLSSTYGTLLSLEHEDNRSTVTHLIPFGGGGGSGRFDFSRAPIGTVLEDYPSLDWGIINRHYYVYNKTMTSTRAVWAVESFPHISPTDSDSGQSRIEAAELLLRAACDWLMARAVADITYSVEAFTLGIPRPGDLVSIDWRGADPTPTFDDNLIVMEVEHRTDESGLRISRLIMNKAGRHRNSGSDNIGKILLDLERTVRRSNFSSGGGLLMDDRGIDFGGSESRIGGKSDLLIKSDTGDVDIEAPEGEIALTAPQVTINGPLYITGNIRTEGGVTLIDEANGDEWALSMLTVRNVPRIKFTRLERED